MLSFTRFNSSKWTARVKLQDGRVAKLTIDLPLPKGEVYESPEVQLSQIIDAFLKAFYSKTSKSSTRFWSMDYKKSIESQGLIIQEVLGTETKVSDPLETLNAYLEGEGAEALVEVKQLTTAEQIERYRDCVVPEGFVAGNSATSGR